MVVYLAAIPLAFVQSWIACALYIMVALMWMVPDPRIEDKIRLRVNASLLVSAANKLDSRCTTPLDQRQ